MLSKRADISALYCELGFIFVIGVFNYDFLKKCEKYDIQKNTLSQIADLNVARKGAASCFFENTHIYVFGGRINFQNEITQANEVYNITHDMWCIVNLFSKSTRTAFSLAVCIPVDNKTILIFGGKDKELQKKNECFKFNVFDSIIEREPPLPEEVCFRNQAVFFDSQFFLLGKGQGIKTKLYVYDKNHNQWKIDKLKLKKDIHAINCSQDHPLKIQKTPIAKDGNHGKIVQCDLCRCNINPKSQPYYNCRQGCHFDTCLECFGPQNLENQRTQMLQQQDFTRVSQIIKVHYNGVGSEAEIRIALKTAVRNPNGLTQSQYFIHLFEFIFFRACNKTKKVRDQLKEESLKYEKEGDSHRRSILRSQRAKILKDACLELCKTVLIILSISTEKYNENYELLRQDRKFSVILDNIDKNKQMKHNDKEIYNQLSNELQKKSKEGKVLQKRQDNNIQNKKKENGVFKVTRAMVLIIVNEHYEEHGLDQAGKPNVQNIPNVEKNFQDIKDSSEFLGIRDVYEGAKCIEKNVYVLKDCTQKNVIDAITGIRNVFIPAQNHPKDKDKIFLYVYYAGHGRMKNGRTEIVFNNKKEQYFDLEAQLTKIACKNTYIMAVFDCCRDLPSTSTRETQTDKQFMNGLARWQLLLFWGAIVVFAYSLVYDINQILAIFAITLAAKILLAIRKKPQLPPIKTVSQLQKTEDTDMQVSAERIRYRKGKSNNKIEMQKGGQITFIFGSSPTNTVPLVSRLSVVIKSQTERNVERNGAFTNLDPEELQKGIKKAVVTVNASEKFLLKTPNYPQVNQGKLRCTRKNDDRLVSKYKGKQKKFRQVGRFHQKFSYLGADDTQSQNNKVKELNSLKCNWLRGMVYAEGGVASSYENFNSIFGDEAIPNSDTLEMILKLADKDGKYKLADKDGTHQNIQAIEFSQIDSKITHFTIFENIKGKLIGIKFFSDENNIGAIGDHYSMSLMREDSDCKTMTTVFIKDDEQITGFYAFSHKRQLFCIDFEICELTDKEFEN